LVDKTLTRQVEAGTGEGNQNDMTLHFGLGAYDRPVHLDILWPNSHKQTIANVTINQLTTIRFNAAP
jgi:hypothetical protein